MMTVAIVPMTVEHLDAVMPHEKAMFGSEAWTRSGYRDELADTRTRYYVAAIDSDGVLLGWAGLHVLYETAQILTVGTVPGAQRQGIGTQLVRHLVGEAVRRGATEMLLEVRVDNRPARLLYEREGFERLGVRRGYYDFGRVDALTMRKALAASGHLDRSVGGDPRSPGGASDHSRGSG